MSTDLLAVFCRIEKLLSTDSGSDFESVIRDKLTPSNSKTLEQNQNTLPLQWKYVSNLITEIDNLSNILLKDDSLLISVKNQKHLRTCFQIITSFGLSPCLIPGIGLDIQKRSINVSLLPPISLSDEQKYTLLKICTDFMIKSYSIPVLKNIIITFHLNDFLAALIQLSFAPLKKPGVYENFVMTEELYVNLQADKKYYLSVYENLVSTCFQPILLKELLVLQSVTNPNPPAFVKKVITKELSRRLLTSGGLLSLIRCFIESYNTDSGLDWKKVDMVSKIISVKHGDLTEEQYLANICRQLQEIFSLNDAQYLTTAGSCLLQLFKSYPNNQNVTNVCNKILQRFSYDLVTQKCCQSTTIMTPQEIEQNVNILQACFCSVNMKWPSHILYSNTYILFLLRTKCIKHTELKGKLETLILKSIEEIPKEELKTAVNNLLFGSENLYTRSTLPFTIEELDTGLTIKSLSQPTGYLSEEAANVFIELLKLSNNTDLITNVFELNLILLSEFSAKRKSTTSHNSETKKAILDVANEFYAIILQVLSELAMSEKIQAYIKEKPESILDFIEGLLKSSESGSDDECISMALILLNTILTEATQNEKLKTRFHALRPVLEIIAKDNKNLCNNLLSKEVLSIISKGKVLKPQSAYEKAVEDIFDNLLPVRAHGVIELTRLINVEDLETLSKKHYVFCLFQEQLKDEDSYLYLAAVKGLAALALHCTEEVLQLLCVEFLKMPSGELTAEARNKAIEVRMKTGDVIVQVTRNLGEKAVDHKNLLLNTVLSACRDDEPWIRTSAFSNLAEIALVLNYKLGTIIYEILMVIWSTIETDKAPECRRAAVMVISSLLKGLGQETLLELKENLLPIYRTLKNLYNDPEEDNIVKLHAQIGLEELSELIKDFLNSSVEMEKKLFLLNQMANE